MIQLKTGDPRPIFKQIADGIRELIVFGKLNVGDKIPSVRGLSIQLDINPNTVAKAYAELQSAGWAESRKGLGLFVIEPKQVLSNRERKLRLKKTIDALVHEAIGLGFHRQQIAEMVEKQLHRIPDTARGARK